MATDIDAVAGQFIAFYYKTFDSDRASLAALYRDNSMLSFEGAQIAGASAIVEKLVTLPFQKVQHKVTTQDAQPLPAPSRAFYPNPLQFSQVFHLIPEGDSYYVFNDIFRLNYA
ncbi:hypothetical protein B0H19DRAFT_1252626 [Mycena capillaripes]|nr:hypothetical protein B0H19DRAFT_1252626 [Mycena capillaripes]